jgi:hypothetical protein
MDLVFVAIPPDGQRREWTLQDQAYQVGRADGSSRPDWLAIEGDPHLSRQHFSIRPQAGQIEVWRSPGARNPLFCGGQQCDTFRLSPGQVFTAGKTQFGLRTQQPPGEATLFGLSREKARLRRLEDCFAAVIQVLERLRSDPSGTTPWRPAFHVIQNLLPRVECLMFLEVEGASQRLLDQQKFGPGPFELPPELLQLALDRNSTVTHISAPGLEPAGGTVSALANWVVLAPMRALESSAYALAAFGSDSLDQEGLDEVAAIIDVVADLVGHHLIVQQAAEYSNLLGVFGHHVGTLFKTSGALKLWADPQQPAEVRQALNHLLPIWGVSQAISLHKKQGEHETQQLPADWIAGPSSGTPQHSLECLVGYVYGCSDEPPFLPWFQGDKPITARSLVSLPPLRDNPMVFDKTLALTIGLIEMLNNLLKYPPARGAGREDRRELEGLSPAERRVQIRCGADDQEAWVEVEQPVVTDGQGQIPQSRSLERIRALERRILRGLVETGQAEQVGTTSQDHIVRVAQRWTYHWGRLNKRD